MSNMEGRGVETWSDGRRYEGDFKNGKKDGEGTFEWPNGNRFVGSWRNGKQHGLGIWISAEGGNLGSGQHQKRQGEWVNGKRVRWINSGEMMNNVMTSSSPIRRSRLSGIGGSTSRR